ncbi:NUDIX hydrolase [Actinomycetospora termitidis]|uniref:NUDIX hydrolase n=1 Tax=Actinomycetospora termitidis TaxID=3053470 RepID=A0ABT7MDR5_9PSEU|nr:NUDIX hydrolase [Actinomycetospora sp. Odt1-22]MDL5158809.1 NUDIX hydrolase [Actinomycetospora sp. Odt1-22]
MARGTNGDGWVVCGQGHRHWGRFGAAGLLLESDGRILLAHRIFWSHHGNTWGIPGGARDGDETAVETALRETAEETGLDPARVVVGNVSTDDHGGWSYTTVHATLDEPVPLTPQDGEASELRWVTVEGVGDLDLHPGFAAFWAQHLAWTHGSGPE